VDLLADNNLSKNVKIGIDVELNKRSVDDVTRQIAELSKNSIKIGVKNQPVTAEQFSAKLFESFFNKKSPLTTKQLIDILPTAELKAAAGQMVNIFKDVKDQLRDVGQQIKYDKSSARYVQTPLGQGRPTKTNVYNDRNVTTADFDKLVRAVKEVRGQDKYYTGAGSAARGNMQIEGIRQLVLQEINQIVGGSANAGVKVSGLAKYISPSQAGITRIEESEAGLTAVIYDVADDLEGLSDEVRAVISALNTDAANLAKILGIRVAPTKLDPRAAFGEFDNTQVEDLRSFYSALKGGQINGQKFNPKDFADFAPGKGGSILVSPALLETAFQRVVEKIAPGSREPGSDIVEAKLADALQRIAPVLDKVNASLFDANIENPNSGRVWGSPTSAYTPGELPSGAAPYSADSMRKWNNFGAQNPEAMKKFTEQVQNEILARAIEVAVDAEIAQIEQLAGQDFSDDDVQHGMGYIMDAINNAVFQYEMQLGLNYGSIFSSLGSSTDPKINSQIEASNIRGALQKPYRDSATGMEVGGLDPSLAFDYNNSIAAQIKSRPEFLKQAGYGRGIQDLMAKAMETLTENVEQQAQEAEAEVPAYRQKFQAIFAKYEGLGIGGVIRELQIAIDQAEGDVSKLLAGFDTEFVDAVATPFTEAAIKLKTPMGEIRDLYKFFHAPVGMSSTGSRMGEISVNEAMRMQSQDGKAGAASISSLAATALKSGFDLTKLGQTGSSDEQIKQNLELYRKKITGLDTVFSLLNDLEIGVAGNQMLSADFSRLSRSADTLNKFAEEFNLEPTVVTNSLQNLIDVLLVTRKLKKSGSTDSGLNNILASIYDVKKEKEVAGLTLTQLASKIQENYPGALPGVQFNDGKVQGINGLPPHTAQTDAALSLLVHDFLKGMFAQYAAMSSSQANWAGPGYGAGGHLLPYSTKTRGKYPTAFGNPAPSQPELTIPEASFNAQDRAAAAAEVVAVEAVTDAQEKKTVAEAKAVKSLREQSDEAIVATKEYKKLEQTIIDSKVAIEKLNTVLAENKDLSREEKSALLVERKMYAEAAYDAKEAQDKLKKMASDVVSEKDYLKEIRRAPYDTLATQLKTGGGSAVRNLDRQVVTVKDVSGEDKSYAVGGGVGGGFGGAGRPPGGGYITERGGEMFGPDPKKTRDASEEIKRQLKDQVEASREAEKATKSLVSTWISGRYALYDVGNAFQNVSQNLFRFSKTIFQFTDAFRNYETAFTSVDRAMQLLGDETQGMAVMFVKLSETMPISFEQLTAIGTLGAQMGVTADGIKNFTEVVAKFSSVTGISAETTAQKFGRIAELANVDYAQFENLGSAIAYAGVNAVATESEILALTESIAAVSEQAGFAPDEIVGLSTAIASLGIAPEQARGVFTRVFADINRAVSRGGAELQNFAKIAGMSSEEFKATWSDPDGGASKAFQSMLAGLKATGNMTKAFDALNITETREVNTLTRLAENLDVVQNSMSDASTAFEDATFLGDSFEKTVDNLDSKIILFQNNFKSAMQSISLSAASGLGAIVDAGSYVLKIFKNIADDSILGPLMNFIYATTTIAGAFTGVGAVISKVLAQIYAFRVAMVNTANDPNIVSGLGGYIKNLSGFGSALVEDHTGLTALNGKMGELKNVTFGVSEAWSKLRGDTTKVFSSLLEESNIYLSSGSALFAAAPKPEDTGKSFKDIGESGRAKYARDEAQAVARVVENRKQLLQVMEDQLPWDEANRAASLATLEAAKAEQIYIYTTKDGIKAVDLDTQMKLKNATAAEIEASAELKAAQANIANAQANKAGAAAINTQTKAQSLASKGALGFGATISAMLGPISIAIAAITLLVMAYEAIATAIEEANTVHLFEDQGGTAAIREAIYKDTQAWKENGEAIATATSKVVDNRKEIPAYKTALTAAAKGQETLKTATEDATDKIEEQTLAIGQNTKELLAKALYENKEIQEAFNRYPEIFSTIEAAGINVSGLLERMLDPNVSGDELVAELEKIKTTVNTTDPIAFTNALSILQQAIKDTKNGIDDALSQSKLVSSIRKMLGLAENLDDTVDGVGATVRTVIDYANDLSSVFERIQQISLERLTARDTVINGWRNIRDAAKAAQQAVKDANKEINDLSADQAMLQYQYDVAKRYGDERRMAILQGKMTANQEKLADATKARNEAEDQASMTLVGSSKAAIANRATLSGMVDGYQNYVLALVRAGVKGKDLQDAVDKAKDSFIKNGESVGFSKDQLDKYVNMFDEFLKAVKKTPRNVTIEFIAEMSAADNALREFIAKANSSKATVKIDAELPDLGGANPSANVDANGKPILYGDPRFVKPGIPGSPTNGSFIQGPEWFKSDTGATISPELAAKGREWGSKYSPRVLQELLKTWDPAFGFEDNINTNEAFASAVKLGLAKTTGRPVDNQMGLLTWLKYLQSIQWNKKDSPYFATGGYVSGPGTGTSDSIPAYLSNGEYVITAKATSAYGADFMNALNQQRVTFAQPQTFAQNSNNSPTMVYLSPEDRALLRAAVDRPVELYTENTKIAQSANAGNLILAQRGMR
jgi:TP901 family phage tail tape measure protein